MTRGALVLAGGGLAGIAWETGVLLGIRDEEPELMQKILDLSTVLVGTSAGSTVAAQLDAGADLQELFDRQLSDETAEVYVEADFVAFMAAMTEAASAATSPDDGRRRVGELAIAADTVTPNIRRGAIEGRLPGMTWGEHDLRLVTVDAETGVPRTFDRDSGVSLVDAVTASCAVPTIWPVAEIDGHRYMDGGTRTMANADLAVGCDPVLVIIPQTELTPVGPSIAPAELDALAPSRVHVIYADAAAVAAFGTNPLDPAVRRPSALAGRELGRSIAARVAAFWAV